MEEQKIAWWIESIQTELKKINDKGFFGSIIFQLNIKDSNVVNMNVTLGKSIVRIH